MAEESSVEMYDLCWSVPDGVGPWEISDDLVFLFLRFFLVGQRRIISLLTRFIEILPFPSEDARLRRRGAVLDPWSKERKRNKKE